MGGIGSCIDNIQPVPTAFRCSLLQFETHNSADFTLTCLYDVSEEGRSCRPMTGMRQRSLRFGI